MSRNKKYERSYFVPPAACYDWIQKEYIQKAPKWCSVDLRDGNQALIEPMSLAEKLEFFQLLLQIGFKEIEVGFPAASETEFQFARTLIEEDRIPKDVTIQVLTQAREHIIRRTFEAVKGAPRAVVHVYNSTSVAQREQVFKKSKAEIKQIAIDGAILLRELAKETEGEFVFEYSPESFQGTEIEYALEVCNAVLDIWKPSKDNQMIINIPTTVQVSMPHIFAGQVEYFHKNLNYRDDVILSIHPHNDRGCGISEAELGILAGADRVEGTLFGNGERTGNVDIVTLALNLMAHGVESNLNLSCLKSIRETYEQLTNMLVPPRQPYAGDLVFTAFSGSHQDAIAKGMAWRAKNETKQWTVPYLPIDPRDVGREYDSDIIRINSQSGKGGVSYILKQGFGIRLPDKMREEVGYFIKDVSDKAHKELTPEGIYENFRGHYIDIKKVFSLEFFRFHREEESMTMEGSLSEPSKGMTTTIKGEGNGRLDAVSNALKAYFDLDYELMVYEEHALTQGSRSNAIAYVGLMYQQQMYWGVGVTMDIVEASVNALVVAVNKILIEGLE